MAKQLPRQVRNIETKEKKGSYGAWRSEFCKKYLELLIQTRNNSYQSLVESLAPKGEEITCRKGCTYCCYHYVAVSLAHGVVIVDYLYRRRELLKQFVDNYEKWHAKGYSISSSIDRTRLLSLSSSMPIDRVIAETRPLSAKYLEKNIACPFLVNHKCLIYDVRPLSCSGHYSVTSPDWCSPAVKKEPVIHHVIPKDEDLAEMMRLSDPRLMLYELTLPTMIYKLLTQGFSAVLSEMTV